jgi:selenocysteine-specific elongation factor
MPIIGTAGHVDHGKSTLVRALTGRDPDRWAEEKSRGLTIDLGFAWKRLGDDDVGFVDVPGHERFIKNMLAGVGGLDVALFVVAADEGWMPQSEEHLVVLDLLGIEHGVIALTRVDLADEDLVAVSRAEIAEHVAGTVAAGWPVVEVAPPAGVGLAALEGALIAALDAAGPPSDTGHPRMWIDRAFTIAGAGTVVTGTLVGGPVSVGDALGAFPGGEVRVRGIQSHEDARDSVGPGTRAALNVTGADRTQLRRGTLLAGPGSTGLSSRFLAAVRVPHRSEITVEDRSDYHIHLGTATAPARLRIVPGTSGTAAVVSTVRQLPLTAGDHFILRDTGRSRVVAGGTVLDPAPIRRPSAATAALLSSAISEPPEGRADALVAAHGELDADRVRRSSGGGTPRVAIPAGDRYVGRERFNRLVDELEAAVDEYHERHPLRDGLPRSEAASRLTTSQEVIDALAAAAPDLVQAGPVLRRSGFSVAFDAEHDTLWKKAEQALAGHLAVPRASELGLPTELMHALIRGGRLIRVGDDLVYLASQIGQITSGLADLPEGFTVADFRDHFALTRRQAVPLLEWLDAAGWTRRDGDRRSVRPVPPG